MWSRILSKLKELLQMVSGKSIQEELKVSYAISPKMEKAITLWTDLYKNEAPWLHEPDNEDPTRITSMGLPSMIASEKARMALLEFESEITTPTEEVEIPNPDYPGTGAQYVDSEGKTVSVPTALPPETITEDRPVSDTQRAEYLEKQYKKLKKQLRKQVEYGIAKGGLVIKPYVVINKPIEGDDEDATTIEIEFDYIQADDFYPLAFDASGKITEAAFIQSKIEKAVIYRRLEYHKWENNTVTIINKAYKSNNVVNNTGSFLELGDPISLSDVPEWKDLQEKTTIKNVKQPLFGYFKMPEANIIDTTSPLGVSGYSRAVSLIKDADIQYSRLLWEYEGGELAIDIDRDALNEIDDGNGHRTVPNRLQSRLYRRVDLGEMDTYQPFAPSLRDANYIAGLNTILMRIEDVCGISRGTLSDSADVARTATELKILKQRSYQTNADIQQAIEDTIRDVVYVMDVYCTLYNIVNDITIGDDGTIHDDTKGQWDISFEWDDSIIVDIDEEINKRITLMNEGLASKLETRMWYFGETERQAQEALDKVSEEQTQAAQKDLMFQSDAFEKEQ